VGDTKGLDNPLLITSNKLSAAKQIDGGGGKKKVASRYGRSFALLEQLRVTADNDQSKSKRNDGEYDQKEKDHKCHFSKAILLRVDHGIGLICCGEKG